MNLIENVWKVMQDHIYANKQYRTVSELEVAILEAVDWFNIEKKSVTKSLFDKFLIELHNYSKNVGVKQIISVSTLF